MRYCVLRSRTWAVLVIVLAGVAAAPVDDRLGVVYHLDFRESGYDFRALKIEGPAGATELVKAGPKGLHINILTWNGVAMTANARHRGGVNLLLGDGSVRLIKISVDPRVWQGLGSIAGGEVLDADQF